MGLLDHPLVVAVALAFLGATRWRGGDPAHAPLDWLGGTERRSPKALEREADEARRRLDRAVGNRHPR